MKPAKFSDADAFSALDRLHAEGKPTSGEALVAAFGGGGNSRAIKLYRQWRAKQATAAGGAVTPLQIPDAAQEALRILWRSLEAIVQPRIAEIQQQAAAEVAESKRREEEVMAALEKVESDAEADSAKLEDQARQLRTLAAAKHDADAKSAALSATGEQLQARLAEQQAEVQRAHADANAEREQHAAVIAALKDTADETQKALGVALAAMTDTAEKLREDLQAQKDRADRLERECALATDQVAAAEVRVQRADAQVEQLAAQREAALREAAETRGESRSLKAQNEQLLQLVAQKQDSQDPKSGHPSNRNKD